MNSVGNSDIKNCLEELPTKTLPNKSILIKTKIICSTCYNGNTKPV